MRIAHNLVVDASRGSKNMLQLETDEYMEVMYNNPDLAQDSYEEEMLHSADMQTLATMISRLPLVQQEIVHLRFYEEMSFKDIARITNVSINTALGRMRYATLNLRKMIVENSLDLAV